MKAIWEDTSGSIDVYIGSSLSEGRTDPTPLWQHFLVVLMYQIENNEYIFITANIGYSLILTQIYVLSVERRDISMLIN